MPTGESLAAAQQLAAELARFPQICLREDRLSMLESEGREEPAAIASELVHGLRSLTEVQAGLERFRGRRRRHGTFELTGLAAEAAGPREQPVAISRRVIPTAPDRSRPAASARDGDRAQARQLSS